MMVYIRAILTVIVTAWHIGMIVFMRLPFKAPARKIRLRSRETAEVDVIGGDCSLIPSIRPVADTVSAATMATVLRGFLASLSENHSVEVYNLFVNDC